MSRLCCAKVLALALAVHSLMTPSQSAIEAARASRLAAAEAGPPLDQRGPVAVLSRWAPPDFRPSSLISLERQHAESSVVPPPPAVRPRGVETTRASAGTPACRRPADLPGRAASQLSA